MSDVDLFLGFLINFVIAVTIVRFIYYPIKHNRNYVFTFIAFNTIIYFVMSILANTQLGLGVGFGLFAIFSVLRYRTSPMSTREMTYLFILIALPVMNSSLMIEKSWVTLIGANLTVLAVLYWLEQEWGFHYESTQLIRYERIELIQPQHHAQLLGDLRERTGLPIKRFEIGHINFLSDSAEVMVYYDEAQKPRGLSGELFLEMDEV